MGAGGFLYIMLNDQCQMLLPRPGLLREVLDILYYGYKIDVCQFIIIKRFPRSFTS